MNVRADAIKLGILAVIGAVVLGLLYLTLGETRIGPKTSYAVLMDDISGLEASDKVRVAGVRVGQVDDIEVAEGNRMLVRFHVDSEQTLTDRTEVLVRYENLHGDRYLELQQEPGAGKPLAAGATIPVERTTPALDLDVLLNGFKPLFRGLDGGEINELATNLVATLQGRGGTVEALLTKTGSLTNTLADDSAAITDLIDNMDVLLESLDSRDAQLRESIGKFRAVMSGYARDRDPLADSVTSIARMTDRLTELFGDSRQPFQATVIAVKDLAKILNTNQATLRKVLDTLPKAYRTLGRIASHGSVFNFYLCEVEIAVGGADGKIIRTPSVRSQETRCKK
ncbi:phospholipid/cholesterol/gamma-HCH transport system substrate-binding protein [Nocardioides sp. J9]|uniref:MCE family protein n=1 Tax=Nocardioides sp. J9 TaxID=935844 RepID=UPI0011A8354D|nr:MlaD family protein [Nocardioides sp. J9]TWG94926.1 phospholipid/cholesterol/gamma-HCH transport system substrate-binding protein [Nocardioides sp. J9]